MEQEKPLRCKLGFHKVNGFKLREGERFGSGYCSRCGNKILYDTKKNCWVNEDKLTKTEDYLDCILNKLGQRFQSILGKLKQQLKKVGIGEKKLNEIWNISKTILKVIVLFMVIFLFFKVVVFDKEDFILENIEIIGYFNQMNRTYTAFWPQGDILRTITKNEKNTLRINEGEVCNEDIVNSDGNCIKIWSNLNDGDIILVAVQKQQKFWDMPALDIPIFKDGETIPEEICKNLSKPLVIYKTGCPGCSIAIPILERIEQDLKISFNWIDIANREDGDYLLNELKFNVRFVPSFISKCTVYTGALEKKEYIAILQEKIE